MTQFAWLDTTFCARLTLTLGHFFWQGLAIAVLATSAGRLLRNASPAARYVVFVAALLLMAVCPPVTFCLVESTPLVSVADVPDAVSAAVHDERTTYFARAHAPHEQAKPEGGQDETPFVFEPANADDGEVVAAIASGVAGDQAGKATQIGWGSCASIATLIYLAGALIMLARLAIGVYGGGRLRRRSSPTDDPETVAVIARCARTLGLQFSPAVAYCQQIAIPTVIGALRPTILLPLSMASGLTPKQLEAILAHELAHIRRYDYLANLIQRLIEAMLFFHPAVWLMSRRIRIERERCCDDLVLATGTEPLSYADSLLKAVELGRASQGNVPAEPLVAVGAVSQSSDLVDRIRRLVDSRSSEPVRLKHPWASLFCTAVVFAVGSFLVLHLNVQAQSAGDTSEDPAVATSSDDAKGQDTPKANSKDATIERLLTQLRDEDWYLRQAAAYELAKTSDQSLVAPLVETLNDERSEVRRAAAHSLGSIGDARAVKPLVATLNKAAGKFEAEAIIRALSEIGDPDAIDSIVAAIGRVEPPVTFHSVRSIIQFKDPRIADLLLDNMRNDSGGFNFNVVSMLVHLKEPRLVEPLLEFLATSDSRKRWRAANALGSLGDPRAVDPLIATLDGSDRNVREAATEALGKLDDEMAVQPLVGLVKREKEADVLRNAAKSLGLLGDETALAALKPLANQGDGRVCDAATRAIAMIELGAITALRAGDQARAIKLAEAALEDGSEAAARAVLRLLGRINTPQTVQTMVRSLKDRRVTVRREAINLLAWIESDVAAKGLAQALSDEDAENRWEAARTLARREDRRATETLIAFTKNGAHLQRRFAAEHLGDLGDPRGVQPLCAMLTDPERRVRTAAAQGLIRVANPEALDSLLKALETEPDGRVRPYLVLALGQICDPRAINALANVLNDNEQSMRGHAARGLARLGWKPETEIQRIRFMMATGRADEAGDLIPKAQAADEKNRLAGKFELNKPILTPLTVGTGEWPSVLMLRSVEFRKQADKLVAVVQAGKFSWPPSSWRISIQLEDDANKLVASGDMIVKTSGVIISVRALESMRPHELNIGPVNDLGQARRFELSVEQVPDDRRPPSPVKITAPAEGPLALAKDIPVKLEAKDPDGQKVVWARRIRFDQSAGDEKKKELKAKLQLQWVSLRKADWRVWLVLLDKEDKMVTRSSTHFSTERRIKGLPKLVDESLEIPLTVWKGGKEPVRFRVGLELTKDHTKTVLAQQSIPEGALQLTHVDDTAEGERSIAASGHAVRFERPADVTYVEAIQIFASRYGDAKPPDEDFHVYVLNEKHQLLADQRFPYSMIERGERCWYTLRTPSVEVPKQFIVALSFNPHRTKGIYLGYDKDVKQSHSLVGLPEDGFEPVKEMYDWMVRVHLSQKPSGEKGVMRLADWKAPVRVDPFKDCIEAKHDTGKSEGIQSYGGSGPAVRFKLAEVLPKGFPSKKLKLTGFRLYASRYGSGYDPEKTLMKAALLGNDNQTLWQGAFPYSLFGYKAKWVDLVLPEPVPLGDLDIRTDKLTVALDPEAHQYKGIYFHYNKDAKTSHSLAGTVAKGFRELSDRQWMIRAFFGVGTGDRKRTNASGGKLIAPPSASARVTGLVAKIDSAVQCLRAVEKDQLIDMIDMFEQINVCCDELQGKEDGAALSAQEWGNLTPRSLADVLKTLGKLEAGVESCQREARRDCSFGVEVEWNALEEEYASLASLLSQAADSEREPEPDDGRARPASETVPKGASRRTHVDDTAEGMKSLGASGHAISFERHKGSAFVEAIGIFAGRYGHAQAPDEDFHVYLLNDKQQVLADLRYPYAMIERAELRWYTLRTPSVEVPKKFNVALSFNPHKTKGIYLGYDNNVEQSHSLVGLPADGFEPVKESYDWMVSVHLSGEPSGKKGTMRLADWKPPMHVDPFHGGIQAKYDTGQSDGRQSYGGSGPAIQFKLTEVLPKDASLDKLNLKGFRLYASRYGSGFDAEQTMLKVAVLGSDNKTLWQGTFPYAQFGYKAKWIDLTLPEPLAFRDPDLKDGLFTVAIDPEANRYKGIYFHYNKDPATSHSLSGTVAKGLRKLPDREWMIRAWFSQKAK